MPTLVISRFHISHCSKFYSRILDCCKFQKLGTHNLKAMAKDKKEPICLLLIWDASIWIPFSKSHFSEYTPLLQTEVFQKWKKQNSLTTWSKTSRFCRLRNILIPILKCFQTKEFFFYWLINWYFQASGCRGFIKGSIVY